MSKILILGIGSPFGDDKLGWEAIAALQQSNKLASFSSSVLQFTDCDRPGIQLLDYMRGSNIVFLIDAVKSGSPIGTIHHLKNADIDTCPYLLSSHEIGIAHALQWGRALNDLPDTLLFYGIEISNIAMQDGLSIEVQKSLKELTKMIEKNIVEILNACSFEGG